MDNDTLLQRKAAIEQRFNEVSKIRVDADDEMKRLEGEFRLVLDLINAPAKPKRIRKIEESTDAATQE